MNKYDEYKKTDISWMPKIPRHWRFEKAKFTFKSPKEINKGNIEKNVLSLTLKGVIENNGEKAIGLSPSDYATYQIFNKDELVFKLIDLNNVSTSRVGLVPERGIMSSAYIRFKMFENENVKYFYYLYFDWYKRQIFNGLGAGVRQTLSAKDLLNLCIAIPPRTEQDQIVRFLDWKISSINYKIYVNEKKVDLLSKTKNKIIDDKISGLFSNNIIDLKCTIRNNDFEIVKMNSLFTFSKGLSITKKDLVDTGTAVISYGQIHSKTNNGVEINDTLIRYVNNKFLDTSKNCLVRKGDFIFADTSEDMQGIGNCVYVDKDITLFAGYHTIITRPKKSNDNKFLAYLFKSSIWRDKLRLLVNAVKVFSVTQKIIKQMYIIIPSKDLERKIVKELDNELFKITNLINKIQNYNEILKELKNRLIYDAVTGQINVQDIKIPKFENFEENVSDTTEDENIEETEE